MARTRRSSAARSGPGSSKGCSPAGSTRPRRARVSASIPLVLVCREKNRRRSAALAELTRYTRWPREPKNTAIGSHAGPVGSMITSKRVPEGVVASAAASTSPRLTVVGQHLRLAMVWPASSITRTVCAEAIPKSIPTRRLCPISSPCVVVSVSTGSPAGATLISGHGPKETRPTDGSHSCAATGPGLKGPAHFPHPGHPWPGRV